jgi:hypothetical protein
LVARADQDFADVAGYADLTKGQRLQLFRALLAAKQHFEFRKSIKAIAKDTAAVSLLREYENSIHRVADLADLVLIDSAALGEKARRLLDEAGERRARTQIKAGAELPRGFSTWEPVPGFTHHGADDFIESFLRAAHVMRSIIKLAQSPPAKLGIEGRAVNFQNSPADWLVGEKLPEIYGKTFGRPLLRVQ